MITLGVLADTHIPDRSPRLDPQVVDIFQQARVKAILHAGDVSIPEVLEELGKIAPVHAVRGNRDIFYLRSLPMRVELNIAGVRIGMAHGHRSLRRYMVDKILRLIRSWSTEAYIRRMLQTFPNSDVIIFGHLHTPVNVHLEGKLVFNPGSTSYPMPRGELSTLGLLHIGSQGDVLGEIITLGKTK
jgi:putative phosphoesterase